MATTIQISEELKQELNNMKKNETYEEVINKLLREHKKTVIAEKMKEYGEKHGKESLNELKDWEQTDIKWWNEETSFLLI